jgi:prevent-host-death family protein
VTAFESDPARLTKSQYLAKLVYFKWAIAMQVTIHAAKTNLSKLIEAALTGEEIVIAKGKKPLVKLVPIPQGKFKIGLLEGRISGRGPDFFEPLDDADLKLWEGGK